MNTRKIKTWLLNVFGENFTAFIHAFRFIYLLKFKDRSDPEAVIVAKFLKPGDIAIDVGANGGNWTFDLLKCVGESGQVYAFEADPYYALATKHLFQIMRWKGITLFDFGLSDKEEDVPLRVVEDDGIRHTGGSFIDKDADQTDIGVTFVKLKTLDSMVEEYPRLLETGVIKCDVEGFELFVFKGAIGTIEKARPVVVLEVGHYEKHGYSNEELFDLFKQRNYQAFAMVGKNTLNPVGDDLLHPKALSVNRILIPSEKIDVVADLIQTP